jgi:hypothetical protein
MQWGDQYLADDGVAPLQLQHAECGASVSLELACEAGHRLAGPRDVRAVPRAAAG